MSLTVCIEDRRLRVEFSDGRSGVLGLSLWLHFAGPWAPPRYLEE
jgi:hypothetical protein